MGRCVACPTHSRAPTGRPPDVPVCAVCHEPIHGPGLISDPAESLHPGCLADRLPYDAATALIAAAALFLIPFVRVWSA